MNNYKSLRKDHSNRKISIILVMLILLEICSLAVLFSRLTIWVQNENENVFPLTEKTNLTSIKVGKMDSDGFIRFDESSSLDLGADSHLSATDKGLNIIKLDNSSTSLPTQTPPVTKSPEDTEASKTEIPRNPGFEVTSGDTVWAGDTDVEIFKVSYENGEGVITVAGQNNDKVIAPGTSNKFSFTLKNTGDVSLNYSMSMEAYVSGTDFSLPVVVRVVDHDGSYCLGSEDHWESVLFLNKVSKKGKLAAERFANFTLEWQWPFEGDDKLDTLLGNLTEKDNITLTIKINTFASECDDPDDPGDNPPPQTGEDVLNNLVWALVAVTLAIVIFIYSKKMSRRKELYE